MHPLTIRKDLVESHLPSNLSKEKTYPRLEAHLPNQTLVKVPIQLVKVRYHYSWNTRRPLYPDIMAHMNTEGTFFRIKTHMAFLTHKQSIAGP